VRFSDSGAIILSTGAELIAPVFSHYPGTTVTRDPTTGGWSTAQLLAAYNLDKASFVKLPDDSILTCEPQTSDSERYIPSLNQWIPDAAAPSELFDPYGSELRPALLLPNDSAFLIGSSPYTLLYTPGGGTNLGTWTEGPDIPNRLGAPDAPAAMMSNGEVFCALSLTPYRLGGINYVFTSLTCFYEYDHTVDSVGVFAQVHAPDGLADATYGAISPGDLLTTSDTPNHCMKVADHTRSQGAVIGKAMSPLKGEEGMVLVLVSLQ
jgi:hypothetical protein